MYTWPALCPWAPLPDGGGLWGVGRKPNDTWSQDLGSLNENTNVGYGRMISQAYGINDNGQIVGSANDGTGDYSYVPFLKNPGQPMEDLGTLGQRFFSSAYGINNSGQIVGTAHAVDSYAAFLKNPGQPMQDLNALTINLPQGISLVSANAINDNGYIVGSDSRDHAFLLTPISSLYKNFRYALGSFRYNVGVFGDECVIYVRNETDIPHSAFNGDAHTYYDKVKGAGYETGQVPKLSSIIVIDEQSGIPVGHVGIVISINGNELIIRDSN